MTFGVNSMQPQRRLRRQPLRESPVQILDASASGRQAASVVGGVGPLRRQDRLVSYRAAEC